MQRLHSPAFFEGAGDALFCGDTLFAGYRIRSDVAAFREIGELLGCRVIPLELHHPYYYHLDTCFCPLAPDLAIYYPAAFDHYGRNAVTRMDRPSDCCGRRRSRTVCLQRGGRGADGDYQ